MGITQIDNVLMILGVSTMMKEPEREAITREMMKGFNDKAVEAGTNVTGGQSVMNPWPMIGGTAISVVPKSKVIMPNNANPGDMIVLTKPLGTQCVVMTIQWLIDGDEKWKKTSEFMTEEELWDISHTAERSMSHLNKKGAELMIKYNAGACTDITGFGIRGHAENLVNAQKKNLKFIINRMPIFKKFDIINSKVRNFKLVDGFSPETSGGLFLTISKEGAQKYVDEMNENGEWAWIIGEVQESENKTVEMAKEMEFIYV
jgi:selenide, water dikinase